MKNEMNNRNMSHDPSPVECKFNKAFADAESFINIKQWELAKNSIKTAISLVSSVHLNDRKLLDLYCKAYKIFMETGEFLLAVEYSDYAINMRKQNYKFYRNKHRALLGCIRSLRKQGQNADLYISNYRSNCQIWFNLAKKQNDKESAAESLNALAESFMFDRPQDWNRAENLAKEVLTLSPQNARALNILKKTAEPRKVTLDDYNNYDQECSPYEEEIETLIVKIISSNHGVKNESGWLLGHFYHYESENPTIDGRWDERMYYYDYYLTSSGQFIRKETQEREILGTRRDPYSWNEKKEAEYPCDIGEVMKALDFTYYIQSSNGRGYEYHGTKANVLGGTVMNGRFPGGYVNTTRLSSKKGQKLCEQLRSILERQTPAAVI